MTDYKDIYGVLGLVATAISRHSHKPYCSESYPVLNYSHADPQDFISEMFWEAIFSCEKAQDVPRS